MQKFTSNIPPSLYPDPSTGYKDKNGTTIKKWFIRYKIEFDEKPINGDKTQYRKEYGGNYDIRLNAIKDLKEKKDEAEILLQWVKDDLDQGIDPENRQTVMWLQMKQKLQNDEKFQYTKVFNSWFAHKNYINPIPAKLISAAKYHGFYINQFIPYLVSIGKEFDIRIINENDINAYISGHYNSGNWSAFTCNTRIGWLGGIFSYALKNRLIEVNPMNFVDKIMEDKVIIIDNIPVLKEKKQARFNIFTDEEVDIIFKELYGSPLEATVKTIYYAFLRTSEMFRLRLGDLDLDNSCFNIRASIAKGQRNGATLQVKIYPPLEDALRRYIERYFGSDRDPKYYLFYHIDKSEPCTYSIFQHHFNALKKRLESRGVFINKTPYAFKHTGAKKFIDINKGKKLTSYNIIEKIMKQMRHTDFMTTQKYIYGDLGINLDEVDGFSFE